MCCLVLLISVVSKQLLTYEPAVLVALGLAFKYACLPLLKGLRLIVMLYKYIIYKTYILLESVYMELGSWECCAFQ